MPQPDYSWMAYLARAGFDVFAMDTTGYGRSIRPAAMNDPCNLGARSSGGVHPEPDPGACAPSYAARDDDHRLRLERHRRRGRLRPRAASRGQGEPAGLVARRTARRRVRGAASGEGAQAGAAGAGVQPRGACGRAGEEPAGRHRDEHAVARRLLGELGSADRLSRPVRAGGRRRRLVGDAGVGSGRRHVGTRRAARAADGDMGLEPGAWWGRCRPRP